MSDDKDKPDSKFGDLRIYPRGFLGAKIDPVLERRTNPAKGLQYNIALFDADDSKQVIANVAIEELYVAMVRNELTAKKFEFREQVLSQVLWAFGEMDFEVWYKAQYQSPSFGQHHSDFLDDCLKFVMTGKRAMSIFNWDAILSASDHKVFSRELPKHASTYFNRRTVDQLATSQSTNSKLVNLVQEWTSQPTGFNDLLTTAHILFGITL